MVSRREQVRTRVRKMLETYLDPALSPHGFRRSPKSFVYKRKLDEASQEIGFTPASSPPYKRDAEAHINPGIAISMPRVGEEAKRFVDDAALGVQGRGYSYENVFGGCVAHCSPVRADHKTAQEWYASCAQDYDMLGPVIRDFVLKYVIDKLDDIRGPGDLIRLYETGERRAWKNATGWVQVAAAYRLIGDYAKAKATLCTHVGQPWRKERFPEMYEKVGKP